MSLLCVLSKVLEKIVHDQVIDYINEHSILNPHQSGFKRGHSTCTALLAVSNDLGKAMDDRLLTILVLYDFSNAFPSVNHDLLLSKLKWYGFSQSVISWFRSYLTNRSQKVVLNGEVSSLMTLLFGVPQGSILGPLLFSLYINDIYKLFTKSKSHLYADDLQNYVSFSYDTINLAVENINNEARALNHYAIGHNLMINPVKTQALIIGNPKIRSKLAQSIPPIIVNDVIIPYSVQVVNLGVTFDANLTWEPHIISKCKKARGALSRLRKHRELLPINVRLRLVQSLVLPILDYCCTVFYDMSAHNALEVQRIQNQGIRFVYGLPKFCHITEHIVNIKWLTMANRRKLFFTSQPVQDFEKCHTYLLI